MLLQLGKYKSSKKLNFFSCKNPKFVIKIAQKGKYVLDEKFTNYHINMEKVRKIDYNKKDCMIIFCKILSSQDRFIITRMHA